jgi:hypothetical protein
VDCDRCLQTKRTSQEKGWGSKNRESIEANDTCNRKQKLFARRVVGHAGLIGVAHRLLSLLTKWSCAIMHQRLPYKGMVLGEPAGVTPLAVVHPHVAPVGCTGRGFAFPPPMRRPGDPLLFSLLLPRRFSRFRTDVLPKRSKALFHDAGSLGPRLCEHVNVLGLLDSALCSVAAPVHRSDHPIQNGFSAGHIVASR